jgi:Hedgehog amino-terminal signalling domain
VAVKSIVDIEINDGAFSRFYARWQDYRKKLDELPRAWRMVADAQTKAASSYREQVALETQSIANAKMIAQAQAQAARMSRTTADVWREMARNTKGVASNITGATSQLMKWASLTSVFSGLLGAGGLFGITHMAEGVAAGRRSSMGLGIEFGEQKAFGNSFGRLVDTDSFMSNVFEAMHSASGKASLIGAGVGNASGNASDVAVRVLENARKRALGSNPAFDAQTMQAYGFDKFMSLQDFQRLRSTSGREFDELKRRYSGNRGLDQLGVSQEDQKKYQDFITTLDAAGDKLNAVFVRGLTNLAPPLEHLSESTIKVVQAFLGAPKLKAWIDDAASGLEKFASYVGTDEFADKVKSFVQTISDAADWVKDHLGWINPGQAARDNAAYRAKVGLKDPATLKAERANTTGIWDWTKTSASQLWDVLKAADANANVPDGLRLKSGAGRVDPGLGQLAMDLQNNIAGINRFTAFDDDYHKGVKSAHNEGRAFDFTLNDSSKENYAKVAEQVRAELRRLKIDAVVLDEANHPSTRATGPHLHVQPTRPVDVRVFNATGGSAVVQTQQAGAGIPQ